MGEILRCWLRTRLGVIVDLRPEIFGRYTRDGSLLARILHSYDIVNRDQLATIAQTQDPALCRINLKHLRVWLRFLGIECEDDTIEDISRGKGTAALRLFYKVYLCLESKDRLHFVTLRKERERFVPTSKKFDVTVVREDPPPYRPADHPSSRRLLEEAKETLDWHRSAFRSILRRVEDRRRREHESSRRPPPLSDPEERARSPEVPPEPGKPGRTKESEHADAFTRAHRARVARLPEAEVPSEVDEPIEEPGRAREYPRDVKYRRRRRAERVALDSRARRALLSRLWHRLADNSDDGLDGAIARRVLDRAVYEKRIVARLCEVREQRKTVADNRRIVEELLAEARERDRRATADRELEIVDRGSWDVGEEGRRLLELRERLRDEKSRKLREKHRKFCAELLGNLIDLAVKIAEYRRTNDGRVPRSIESEWRALVARGRSVFEDGTSEEDEEEEVEEEEAEGEADEQIRDVSETTLERISIRREAILESYLEVDSPWDELAAMVNEPSEEDPEPGRRVLGYAVHRLLEFLYPRPASLARATRRPAVAAIVLGVGVRDILEAIRALLARQGVRAVCLEDAINECLSSYREQLLDAELVDANVVAATDAAVARILFETGVRVDCGRRKSSNVRWSKSDESMGIHEYPLEWPSRTVETTSGEEEEEERGAALTEAARLGKWVHELLTLGEPIPTALATRILTVHLASLETDEGWVLIDYPTTYDQMRDLEESLTGRRVPPDPRTLDFNSVDIEEIEPLSPRIVFEDETADAFASLRRSRLLPDPLAEREDEPETGGTFVTVYAKLVPRPRSLEAAEDGSREDLPPDASSIDAFYAARGVARVLYHSGLDGMTLRRLARLVLGDLARERSSAELFGDALDVLPRDPRKGIAGSTGPIVRRLTVARAVVATEEEEEEEEEDEEEEEEGEGTANHGTPARPGEIGWPWVDLPLPAALRDTLARAWVCLERAYVRDLEELLFVRSVHVSGVVPYKDSVTRQARSFLERPDERRSLLRDFQDAFNAVDPDAREDADVKCELHRRLGDLQTLLWELCDRRRREAEAERRRLAEDRWTEREARVLLDVYAGILRAETERCVETVRLLRDYYGGMLREGQPPRELGLDRLLPERTQLGPDRAARLPEKRLEERSRPGGSAGTPKASRTPRTIVIPPAVVDPAVIDREIAESLVEPSEVRPDASESSLCRAILETARYHRDVAEELRAMVAGELGREEAAVISRARRTAEGSPGTGSRSRDSSSSNLARQAGRALAEWRSAATYELERTRFRLELLVAAARADVAFLLDTVRDGFRRIREDILDRYQREAETVGRTASLYGLAIEEARPIESEAILEGDTFVLRRDVVSRLARQREATILESGQEADLPFRFSGPRLARLADILARVAVEGVLTERALVYVLRDAASHTEEDGEDSPLPPSWGDLTAEEVADLVGRLFGPEDRIDWREFVVYATDLPLPSHRELLRARQRFVAQDPELGELVDRDRCLRTPLWIDESPPRGTREECWEGGETSARDGTAAMPEVSSELRELLCRMYSTDRRTVNYTALLLAFCKDEDPREGLGKALSLAIGRRVCTDAPRGERYVEELLERKRPRSATESLLDESTGEGGSVVPSAEESLFDGFATEAGEEALRREEASSRTVDRSTRGESSSSLGDGGPIAYWISRDVFLAVLAASLPCRGHVSGMPESVREAVALAYEELRDDSLTDEEDVVLAHRLLRHELVTRLLAGTNRFTGKSAARIAGEILRGRKNLGENRR